MATWIRPPSFRFEHPLLQEGEPEDVARTRSRRLSSRFSRSARPRRYVRIRDQNAHPMTSRTTPNRAHMMIAAECGRFHMISLPIVFIARASPCRYSLQTNRSAKPVPDYPHLSAYRMHGIIGYTWAGPNRQGGPEDAGDFREGPGRLLQGQHEAEHRTSSCSSTGRAAPITRSGTSGRGSRARRASSSPTCPGTPGAAAPPSRRSRRPPEWVADFVKELGLKKFILAGHSMGGAIAIQAALNEIPGIEALILIASGREAQGRPRDRQGNRGAVPRFRPGARGPDAVPRDVQRPARRRPAGRPFDAPGDLPGGLPGVHRLRRDGPHRGDPASHARGQRGRRRADPAEIRRVPRR